MRQSFTPNEHGRGERGNALWGGKGKKVLALLVVLATSASLAALATPAAAAKEDAYATPSLRAAAEADPDATFDVIVQARLGKRTADAADEVASVQKEMPASSSSVKRRFASIDGVSATLTGSQVVKLADKSKISSITLDTAVELTATNGQLWPAAAGVVGNWESPAADGSYPTIAVIDSGVTNAMLGSRFFGNVTMVSNPGTSGAYGHGTLVASIAASGNEGYAGAEPRAKVISLKVLDGAGKGAKSDVIAACDWILANRSAYNIRVANFSLNTGGESFRYDALDRAVERLWFAGIVVVAASGNYAQSGAKSDVGYAPANDPFVITVGASDIRNSVDPSDDGAAPWSAWGSTQDGFTKPEVAAPGRWMIGSVPSNANLALQYPQRVVAPGYMWMSGTSFAAPVVSGIAASILAKHPTWTPDQVKGAIMQTVSVPSGYTIGRGLGVGVVNGTAAANAAGNANPNAAPNQFIDRSTGSPVFDGASWYAAASSNASWASASWASASWSSASWSSASWSSASRSSASWASASWASASWANASWANSADDE